MRIADVLPLTPLQQGLLFHASAALGGDDVYAVQLYVSLSGPLDQDRLRAAVQAVVARHPNLAARFSQKYPEPVQILLAEPVVPWQYVELDGEEQIAALCAEERIAVCELGNKPVFRAALIRTGADQYRFVLTNHHIVLDGWSLPILLGEVFASYYGQRLPPAAPYRRFVTWLTGAISMPLARRGGRCWPVSIPRRWSARRAGCRAGERSRRFRCPRTPLGR